MADELQTTLRAEIEGLSDNQLIDRAAHYNAALRRGRRLMAEGEAIVSANINPFVYCQNELQSRIHRRIENETDQAEKYGYDPQ